MLVYADSAKPQSRIRAEFPESWPDSQSGSRMPLYPVFATLLQHKGTRIYTHEYSIQYTHDISVIMVIYIIYIYRYIIYAYLYAYTMIRVILLIRYCNSCHAVNWPLRRGSVVH